MTSPAIPASTQPATTVEAICDVCPHPAARHDAIGLRFCQATLDGAISRGCICRS